MSTLDYSDLIDSLRALSAYRNSDTSLGDDAADALEELTAENKRLSAQLAKVNARCDHLGMRLGEIIKERDDALRGWLLVADIRADVGDNNAQTRPELVTALRALTEIAVMQFGRPPAAADSPLPQALEALEPVLEALVDRCNHDCMLANDDAVIAAEAALERLYKARKLIAKAT